MDRVFNENLEIMRKRNSYQSKSSLVYVYFFVSMDGSISQRSFTFIYLFSFDFFALLVNKPLSSSHCNFPF